MQFKKNLNDIKTLLTYGKNNNILNTCGIFEIFRNA